MKPFECWFAFVFGQKCNKSATGKGNLTPHHLSLSHLRSLFYRISVSPRHNVTTFGFDLLSYSLNHLRADPCAAHLGENGIRAFPIEHQNIPGPALCDIPAGQGHNRADRYAEYP
jgi:hypothetical protein